MKTVQEIIEWVEEESATALQRLRQEQGDNNHLLTAYAAEYDLLEQIKDFIQS